MGGVILGQEDLGCLGRYLSKPREEVKKHYSFIVSVSSSSSEFSLKVACHSKAK